MRNCFIFALLLTAAPVFAADEGAAEYREHTMEAVGGHMQAIVDIIRRKVPHTSHLTMHVNAIDDIAKIVDTLFPAGSEGGDALPAIWTDPADFAAKIQTFQMASAALREAAASGDMAVIGPGLGKMGEACKGCHDNYRAE
jgi:cytochrome c556